MRQKAHEIKSLREESIEIYKSHVLRVIAVGEGTLIWQTSTGSAWCINLRVNCYAFSFLDREIPYLKRIFILDTKTDFSEIMYTTYSNEYIMLNKAKLGENWKNVEYDGNAQRAL